MLEIYEGMCIVHKVVDGIKNVFILHCQKNSPEHSPNYIVQNCCIYSTLQVPRKKD